MTDLFELELVEYLLYLVKHKVTSILSHCRNALFSAFFLLRTIFIYGALSLHEELLLLHDTHQLFFKIWVVAEGILFLIYANLSLSFELFEKVTALGVGTLWDNVMLREDILHSVDWAIVEYALWLKVVIWRAELALKFQWFSWWNLAVLLLAW